MVMIGVMSTGHTMDDHNIAAAGAISMLDTILALIQQFWTDLQQGQLPQLGPWNYLLLSLMIILQGPLATLLGGAAASAGLLRPGLVFLAGISGNLTADIVWYRAGRLGRLDWILRASHRFGVTRDQLERLQIEMRRHAIRFLLLAKLSPGFAVPTLITAGLARVPWRRWFPVVFFGESLWTGSLLLLGYFATEAIKQVEHSLQILTALMASLFLVLLFTLSSRWMRQAHEQTSPIGPEITPSPRSPSDHQMVTGVATDQKTGGAAASPVNR